MNLKSLFLIILSFTAFSSSVFAQVDEITPLLQEREKLMQQYNYYSSQKSNFWGKQSKKDLMKVIDVLKEIIRNDTKLVTAYKNEQLRKTATLSAENTHLNREVKSNRNIIEEQMFELQSKVRSQETQLKSRDRKLIELQQQIIEEKKAANQTEQYLFVAGILLFGSVIYNIVQSRRKRVAKKR